VSILAGFALLAVFAAFLWAAALHPLLRQLAWHEMPAALCIALSGRDSRRRLRFILRARRERELELKARPVKRRQVPAVKPKADPWKVDREPFERLGAAIAEFHRSAGSVTTDELRSMRTMPAGLGSRPQSLRGIVKPKRSEADRWANVEKNWKDIR
jgi:hypothetical protein